MGLDLNNTDNKMHNLKSLHDLWNKLTGQELKYLPCERLLWDYFNNGFSESDLETVLTFMIWQNKKREPRYRNKLLFHRIVGDLEFFNSIHGEAAAWARNRRPAPTEKAKTVAAFRGTPVETESAGTSRTFREVLKGIA